MAKPNISKLVKSIKANLKAPEAKKVQAKPTISTFRERDMRAEAMDLGSHGAKEYFGGKQ